MFGVSLMMIAAMMWIFEADIRAVEFSFDPINVSLLVIQDAYGEGRDGRVIVPTARLVALGINALLIIVLTYFLYRTLTGKAIRAAIMNREAIQIVGINIHSLSASAFGLAAALAGITGVVLAFVVPSIDPNGGQDISLIGFIIIVLGGLGHPVGALIAGILFGLVEQIATVFLPSSSSNAWVYYTDHSNFCSSSGLNGKDDTSMIPKIVLQLKGLNKSFGGLLAVKNVDMLVNESSISGLIGINGAGKTTLMNCISGIYRADSGSLDIMGVSCLNWSPHDIARLGVGRTFQIPRIFKRINLIDNVMVPALNDNTDNKTLYERATECLDKVKLYDLRHNNAEELSERQQKLLELARIMMFNPKIILLDEPFAGVNPTLCRLMIEHKRTERTG